MKTITGFKAIYCRYKKTELEYFDTFEEAVDYLTDGEEDRNLTGIAILGDNGMFWAKESFVMPDHMAIEFARKEIAALGYTPGTMAGMFKVLQD